MSSSGKARCGTFLHWGLLTLFLLGMVAEGSAQESPAPATVVVAPIYCPVCGAQNKPGSRFCLRDGTPLPTVDPSRVSRSFVRATETYSAEEIQAAIHEAARSVVRVRVKVSADFKYPRVVRGEGYLAFEKIEEGDLAGSGFVIDESGLIVTNAHVAAPFGTAGECTVETLEQKSLPAKVIGVDAMSDLALLKIEDNALPALSWGDSESVLLGEEVWALGNPLDIGLSMTRGTISSLVRTRLGQQQVENFLHADAFTTEGNSGGPLVSVRGLVVGVTDVGVHGLKSEGYFIPSKMARWVVEALRKGGAYRRGFVGLQVRPLDAETIKKYSIQRNAGIVVESVLPGTPAETAGFRFGDLIFGINGHGVTETYTLQEAISSVGPQARLSFLVERGGKMASVELTTALRPAEPRIDPVQDLQRYLQADFVEDVDQKMVKLRILDRYSLAFAYGFDDGEQVESVLAAQDWPTSLLTQEIYRTEQTHPIKNLGDLREALKRMYLKGRVGVAMSLIKGKQTRVNAVALPEEWAIVI